VYLPGAYVVRAALGVPPREEPIEVLCIDEVFIDYRGGIRVAYDVLAKLAVVLEDVVDDPAQESDVAPGAEGYVEVRYRAGAGVAQVYVDDRRPPEAGLHHVLKADRVVLGHVRTDIYDTV
jgi:hypothetical protein